MITYTLIPYTIAREAGIRQMEILDRLSEGLDDPTKLNLEKAKSIIESDFYPWLQKKGFGTEHYLAKI